MLELNRVTAGYSGKSVLHDITLRIPPRRVTAILGPNGCGKTTLLKTLCGILKVSSGDILLDGESITTLPQKELARRVAHLSQSRQIPDITAGRLVLHGRFPYLGYPRRYRPADFAAAKEAMEQMGISDLAGTPLNQLSGGQRQKVYIAMALTQNTPVILLDEPTTYLDISHQLQLMRQAGELARRRKTVVMVVHDLSHAMSAADEIILMDKGQIVSQGSPEELFASRRLDTVFGIRLQRTETARGWHYYCEEG